MGKYVIAIEETVVQEFEVMADSAESALEIAKEHYRNGVFVLSPGEVQSKKITIIEPSKQVGEWSEF